MGMWQSIVAAVLGDAIIVGVLGWLGRSLLSNLMLRDMKRFEIELKAKSDSTIEQLKSELKAKSDSTIEQLKSQLQIRSMEHQVRFSGLHEKRALVIAELNSLIIESLWEAESFLSLMESTNEPNKVDKHNVAINKLVELYRYFDKHQIYLPEHLCKIIEKFVINVRTHVSGFGRYLSWDEDSILEHTRIEKHRAWTSGWEANRNDVPIVRKELEDEFRKLLAPIA